MALPPGNKERRESALRDLIAEGKCPLKTMARIMCDSDHDPRLQLDAAKALAPYLYATLKAVTVEGADGGALVVEVRKAG